MSGGVARGRDRRPSSEAHLKARPSGRDEEARGSETEDPPAAIDELGGGTPSAAPKNTSLGRAATTKRVEVIRTLTLTQVGPRTPGDDLQQTQAVAIDMSSSLMGALRS
jgi:hypothetical protein